MLEQVQLWFDQAVEVPPARRLAFLMENCRQEAVRSEVLSLLDYDLDGSQPVPESIRRSIASILREDVRPPIVQRVGAFELGKLLGSGGMGLVYEAHRVDGQVRQRAAVKFAQVSPSASERCRESVHRRFARERQMLASLRHPYIAGLIDAGTTPDGIPYAIIEQVDGVPIDDYCDAWLPDREDRIRLVLKLCDAVQFAHSNLIVHSDLKPDNVLITADGIPKLIDFGAANVLAGDATLPTLRAFTPGYASPELCSGMAPTVATDIYGLGSVLYRLLTGAKPRGMQMGTLGEEMQTICAEDVVQPSVIRPELKGDLENILLKALQREPGRRYRSAPEFADDLNRYLARRPVRATPDSAVYRFSRFLRRHWAPLTATAMLAAALVVATGASLLQRRQALTQAAASRRLAEQLLFEVHDEIGGVLGATRAREKLGDMAVQYLEALGRDRNRDPELDWELLNGYSRLAQSRGGVASSVGDTSSGVHFAAKALDLGAAVESARPDVVRLDALFRVYDSLVPIFLEAGRAAEQREAIDRMLRLAPELPPLRLAQALKHLARFQDANGSPQQASAAWARSLAILRTLSAAPSNPREISAELAATLVGFGRAQALAGDFQGAISSLHEAGRLSGQNVAAEPNRVRSLRCLYWSHIALGDVLGSPLRFSLGRPLEAAEQYRKARIVAETLGNADPANDMARIDLSRAFSREGVALAAAQPQRALELLELSRAVASQTAFGNQSGLDAQFAYLTSSVGPLVRLGQFEKARVQMSEARRLARQMRQAGITVDQQSLLKAEATRLNGLGRRREALAEAQRHLNTLPRETRATLSENFTTVEVLERIRGYAAGLDPAACASASERLVRIWSDLQSAYPKSDFVRDRAESARKLSRRGC